jgi:transposase
LYWQLTMLGIECQVVAPTLIPTKAGDRVKTDRRDAEKLARCHRAGDLTPVWVPDAAHEALRDLIRAREAAKKDQLRARHRLGKFLMRHGQRPATTLKAWTAKYMEWIHGQVHFELAALEATLVDYPRTQHPEQKTPVLPYVAIIVRTRRPRTARIRMLASSTSI